MLKNPSVTRSRYFQKSFLLWVLYGVVRDSEAFAQAVELLKSQQRPPKFERVKSVVLEQVRIDTAREKKGGLLDERFFAREMPWARSDARPCLQRVDRESR